MTDKQKAEEIAKKHMPFSGVPITECIDATLEMAEWKEKQMIEKACDAYCRICDTQECFNDGNCNLVEKFRKTLNRK